MSNLTYYIPCGCERHEEEHSVCNDGCEQFGCAHPSGLVVFTTNENLRDTVAGGDDTPDSVIIESAQSALRHARAQYKYDKAWLELIIAKHQ